MQPELVFWLMPAGAAVFALLGVITLVTQDRDTRAGAHWLMLMLTLWIVGGLLEMVSGSRQFAFAGIQLSLACAALVPPLGLLTASHIAGKPVSQGGRMLVMLVPSATIMLLLMQPYSSLVWSGEYFSEASIVPDAMNYGPWFVYVHAPVSFTMCLACLLMLVRDAFRHSPHRRRSVLALSAAALVPITGSFLHLIGFNLYFSAPTPMLLTLVAPVICWLVLRHGVLLNARVSHKMLFQHMSDGIMVLDSSARILTINQAATRLLSLDPHAVIGKTLREAMPHIPLLSRPLPELHSEHEIELETRDLAFRIITVEGEDNSGDNDLLVCRDVTRERAARRELVRSEELLRSLINNSSNAILRLRMQPATEGASDFTILVANPVAAEFFRANPEQIIGRNIVSVVHAANADDGKRSLQSILPVIRDAAARGETTELEFRNRTPDGDRWFRMVADPAGDDIGIICIDITRQRQQEIELESAAFVDPLTGVMNRRGFERRASACLAEQEDDAVGALLFVDLDNFKRVNDIHGHETGDLVLQLVAERLVGALRDIDIVARLGGDEFVVLAPQTKASAAGRLRERLEDSLSEPYNVANMSMNSSASVGIALFPDQGITLTSLMRSADASMYERKTRGRTTISGSYRVVSIGD